ncbi:MAG: radical SAM protein [Bacilli bacterium]|jgi:uncharacterized protein|nr:radical SAM protein [Bacilli bacterium]
MKWSMFIIRVAENKQILLYNTFNSAIVIIEQKEYRYINSNLDNLDLLNKNIKVLIKEEFLIDKNIDEKQQFLKALQAEWQENKHFCIHILPTTACNFSCPYCYQCGIERDYFLDTEKLNKTINYIDNYLEKKEMSWATLIIHGGEPTVYWEPVIKLLPKINQVFKKYKVSYNTQIVSNGYNLTKEKIDLLAKYNWNRFQVTLDGPAYIHDNRRKLKNGMGTFDKIVENIRYAIENNKIKQVSLRINYDNNNIKYIPELLKYIKRNFDINRIILSFGFISNTIGDSEANKYVLKHAIDYADIKDTYTKLYKIAIDLGFAMDDLFMFDGMCTAKLDNAMVISADGNIYKCLSGVGRKEFVVNTIDSNNYELPNYLFLDLYEQCLEKQCEFLPLCNTGCRFNAYLKNKNINSIDCHQEWLKKINNKLLKIIYFNK